MSKKSEIIENPRLYVPFWFSKQKDPLFCDAFTFDELWLDYEDNFKVLKSKNSRAISEKSMLKAFNGYTRFFGVERLKRAQSDLKCERESYTELRLWLMAVTGEDRKTDLTIIQHWIWMVKRKLNNKPVKWQVMPVVISKKQGNGKSTAIRALFGPIKSWQYNMQMNKLADESVYPSLASNLVVFFDELEGIQKTDLNTLKNQITTDENSYRPLYKQDRVTVPMRCSFIGASNRDLDESFFDATGMRRFYGIKASDTINWEAVNSIDYLALWLGIDESREDGYMVGEALEAVQKVQATYVNSDDIEDFAKENNIITQSDKHKVIPALTLFDMYKHWAMIRSVKFPSSYQSFNKKMKNHGALIFEKQNDKKTRVKYYKVHIDCAFADAHAIESTILEWKV